jgi:hypothetical protein
MKEGDSAREWRGLLEKAECADGRCYGFDIYALLPENMDELLMGQIEDLRISGYSREYVTQLVRENYRRR